MTKLLEQMIEDLGLETILEQNDIEEIDVLEILVDRGLINLEDYLYEDVEQADD